MPSPKFDTWILCEKNLNGMISLNVCLIFIMATFIKLNHMSFSYTYSTPSHSHTHVVRGRDILLGTHKWPCLP